MPVAGPSAAPTFQCRRHQPARLLRKCPSCGFQAQRTSTVVTEDGVLYEGSIDRTIDADYQNALATPFALPPSPLR